MENQEIQTMIPEGDAPQAAFDGTVSQQQQEAFNIGLDLQLRVKALEFARDVIVAAAPTFGWDSGKIGALAGAAFVFLKFGNPEPVVDSGPDAT